MKELSGFHEGELNIQKVTGVQDAASKLSKIVRSTIPASVFSFIHQQSVVWIGIEDEKRFLWAFPLFGSPGFISPRQGDLLEIDLLDNFPMPDEWRNNLKKEKHIGCLIIDLSTRNRIRINGTIREADDKKLRVCVQQVYPNCQKYIRKRILECTSDFAQFVINSSGDMLSDYAERVIRRSDTAFVASQGPNGADVSHRGGPVGFMKHIHNRILVPDFRGNNMFNTLGNFNINPRGGLTIVDFKQQAFLQVSGDIKLIHDAESPQLNTGGTNRYWELKIHKWRLFELKSDFKWSEHEFSPYNP